jgi:hypothetical protein
MKMEKPSEELLFSPASGHNPLLLMKIIMSSSTKQANKDRSQWTV